MPREDSPPDLAAARILGIMDGSKAIAIKTGGDPAECVYEMLAAAMLICMEQKPVKQPEELLADMLPFVRQTVDAWFPEMVKRSKRRDA